MENEEIKAHIQSTLDESDSFKKGYISGMKHANWVERRNKTLETALMELIGLDKEWLLTSVGYKKRKNADLIQIIMEQRQLMRMLFESLDEEKKKVLREKVKNIVWEEREYKL